MSTNTDYPLGEVALALAERLEARETQSLVTYTVFAYIHHWTNDLRVSVKPLQYGYKVGMVGTSSIMTLIRMRAELRNTFTGDW